MADIIELAETLSQLTVLEAAELSKMLEQKWGVSASAPVQVAQQATEAPPEIVEEQVDFNVLLMGIADASKKINIIKEVRGITGLGLKESKELVETPPKMLRETVNKVDALAIKAKIEAAGGIVELQ
jgi:large subunit ribosomal protein L7/L12